MRRTWTGMALVLAAAGMLGAGCGDDDDAPVTEEVFLEQGNAVCESGNQRIDALEESTFTDDADFENEDLVAEFKSDLEADIAQQIADLRALEPPTALAADFDALLDSADAALADIRAMTPQEFADSEDDPFAEVNAAADALGLVACSDDEAEEDSEGDAFGVEFVTPADGDETTSPVHIEMAAEGIIIEPAANGVNEGAGHFHVIVDHPCVTPGETIPAGTDGYNHFGMAQTEADLELAPGEHTLCLQAGDGAHTALDATDEITITVTG